MLVRHGGRAHIDVGLDEGQPLHRRQVQMVGDEGHVAVGVGLAHLGGEEPAVHVEGVHILRLVDLRGVGGQAVGHRHVAHPVGDGVQLPHEQPGLRRAQPGDDHIVGLDEGQGLLHGDVFFLHVHSEDLPVLVKLPRGSGFSRSPAAAQSWSSWFSQPTWAITSSRDIMGLTA